MIKNNLFKYQLASPNLPVGGFCYSEGLESFINKKSLSNEKSIKRIILDELNCGQIRVDAKSLHLFMDHYENYNKFNDLQKTKFHILSLNKWLLASRDTREIRDQQRQMGKSLLALTKSLGFEFFFNLQNNISWPLAWSWACFCSDINLTEMIENFLFAWSSNQLSAAIRLVPIGSTKAQIIQYEILETISNVSSEIIKTNIQDIRVGNIALSMAQQEHHLLYSKLFRN